MSQIDGIEYFLNQISEDPTNKGVLRYAKCLMFYFKWKKFLKHSSMSPFTEGLPWMNFVTIHYLKKIVKKNFKIFEFGGGGSTRFFYNRSAFLHTTEHDKEWFDYFTKEIPNKNDGKWKAELHAPTVDSTMDQKSISNPFDYFSDDKKFKQNNFKNYATSISAYPDNFFDLVLVDGRVRPSCMYHSINKIKPGGYLCLDNSERDYYLKDIKDALLKSFDEIHSFYGPVPSTPKFTKATIWRKK